MTDFKLITPQTRVGSEKQIDWKRCFLCQEEKREALQAPLNKPGMCIVNEHFGKLFNY